MTQLEDRICRLLENSEDLVLASVLSQKGSTPRTAGTRMVIRRNGTILGTIGGGIVEARVMEAAPEVFETRTTTERSFDLTHPITDTMDMICGGHMTVRLEFIEATPENREKFKQSLEESRRLHKTAFLFGAGHVSRQLAKLTQMVEFRTVVLDDRSEFANRDRFPGVDQVHVLDRFENTFSGLSTDSNSFIVILTRGHSHDRTVLAQALRTQAGYIGMIGSHRKRDTIYRSLRDEGFTTADLDRVHCPIGLDIGGETPEEIAVSIVAEMIEVRSGLK
ncbi:MAG: xanthine dehydrogenase accessory protein XdhC [Thermodesulfobacteriota bacterium]